MDEFDELCLPLPDNLPKPTEEVTIDIPLSLLYRLADQSPTSLWNMQSVREKLADMFGPGELRHER